MVLSAYGNRYQGQRPDCFKRSYLNFHQTMIPADGSVGLSLSRFGGAGAGCVLCACVGRFFACCARAFTRVRVLSLTL